MTAVDALGATAPRLPVRGATNDVAPDRTLRSLGLGASLALVELFGALAALTVYRLVTG